MLNTMIYSYASSFLNEEREMCAEFSKRKEEAIRQYWDAVKYPRKKKKAIRKIAKEKVYLYSILEQPIKLW